MFFNIAIDGPSGVGKSTLAKKLSQKLNFCHLDTGALYRTVAYFFFINQLNFEDENLVLRCIKNVVIDFKIENNNQRMFLNGIDVTFKIRKEEVSIIASRISAYACVRHFLLDMQLKIACRYNTIMDGRDIGTNVLKNADVKIFLDAPLETRALRRFKELYAKDKSVKYESVLCALKERDLNDMTRKNSPLMVAKDAVIFNTEKFSIEENANIVLKFIKSKINL